MVLNLKYFLFFKSVLGDKLVKNYLLDSDLLDEPLLPSPNQLKYKILIKNKKIQKHMFQSLNVIGVQQQQQQQQQSTVLTPKHSKSNARLVTNKFQNSTENWTTNQLRTTQMQQFSIDETNPMPDSGELRLEESNDNSNENTANATAAAAYIPIKSKFGKKLKKIGSRFTFAEPNLKKNVANFIHKSKSLTDSAFNKLGARAASKVNSHKTQFELGSAEANNIEHTNESSDVHNNYSPIGKGAYNESVPESASTSVVGIATLNSGSTAATKAQNNSSDLMDLSYLSRIRKR